MAELDVEERYYFVWDYTLYDSPPGWAVGFHYSDLTAMLTKECVAWCKDNLIGACQFGMSISSRRSMMFERDEDAVLFALRWL